MIDIQFCGEDTKEIETKILSSYETIADKKLYPADPVTIFLKGLAYVIAHQRALINETGRQNLLRYASDDKLDALGELVGTYRIPASSAAVTCRFTRAKGSSSAVFIREGLRVTGDSKVFFKVVENTVIPAGAESTDIRCVAMTAGAAGNGYAVGDINKVVDVTAYLSNVVNLTESNGGADTETDNALRERIRIAPERFSVAGPVLAYKYFAKSAHVGIEDVAVLSSEPGKVEIYPLMINGALPTQEVMDKVAAAVSDEKVRPLTDLVSVTAPVQVGYKINCSYYLYDNSTAYESDISAAAERYKEWQGAKLGRDINPNKLITELMTAGAKRIELVEPLYKPVAANEVAVCESVSITFQGLEDE